MENVLQNPNVTLNDLVGGDLSYPNVLSTMSFPKIGKDNIQMFLDDGLIGDNHQSNMMFLKFLQYSMDTLEVNIDDIDVITLSEYTSVLLYSKDGDVEFSFCGLKGKYNRYISQLIETIENIDITSIDLDEFIKFHIFEDNKIFKTHTVENSDENRKFNYEIRIDEVSFINYILHILPQYLPSDVKLHPSIIGIINGDRDDISMKLKYLLQKKSMEYLNEVNIEDISNDLIKGEWVS